MAAMRQEALEIPKWKIEMAAIVAKNGKYQDGKVMDSIKEFAARRDLNWMTVRSAYYQFLNKIPANILDILTDPRRDILEAVEEHTRQEQQDKQQKPDQPEDHQEKEDSKVTSTITATPSNPVKEKKAETKTADPKVWEKAPSAVQAGKRDDLDYPAGKTIEVIVKDIQTHGVVVETNDTNKMEGWIYIGNVANKFVNDLNKYFQFGQTVHAKVVCINEARGNIELSTRDLPLKEHGVKDPAAAYRKLDAAAPQLSKEEEQRQEIERLKKQILEEKEKAAKAAEAAKAPLPAILGSEMDEIKGFVKGAIGWDPSEKAIQAFAKLFTTFGMFKTTLALGQVAQGFEVDLGLLLAAQVEQKLGGATFRS